MRIICLLIFVSFFLVSCFGSKPVAYFNGNIDTSLIQNSAIPEAIIQPGDLLSITIYSDNPEATSIYNQAGGTPAAPMELAGVSKSVAPTGTISGYFVDSKGYITMHEIGMIKAAGLTKAALIEEILKRIKALGVLSNPYCVVRFSNFKVTILGEVRSPGVFTLPVEKASVIEALGLAGDVTDYSLKDRIMLIREEGDKRTFHYLNLLDPSVFSSPYFYLKQNDIVMVQPDKRKPTALDQQSLQYIMVGATVVSSIAILITLFR